MLANRWPRHSLMKLLTAGLAAALLVLGATTVLAASEPNTSSTDVFDDKSQDASGYRRLLQPWTSAKSSLSRLAGSAHLQSVSSLASTDVAPSPSSGSVGTSMSFFDHLSRHWREADSTKQTFMAVFLIIQIVGLACAIKGSLDKLFGRRAEYRNRRTKKFARRAAIAAAGGTNKDRFPLSHQRALYQSTHKPQLPPRPTKDSYILQNGDHSTGDKSNFSTTQSGDIVLPSWTSNGPTPLKVIVEEPEREEVEELFSHVNRRNDSDDSAATMTYGSAAFDDTLARPASPSSFFSSQHPWSLRSNLFSSQASLRLRERNEPSMLPFVIDRSSTPDVRLEEVKRPFNNNHSHMWMSNFIEESQTHDPEALTTHSSGF